MPAPSVVVLPSSSCMTLFLFLRERMTPHRIYGASLRLTGRVRASGQLEAGLMGSDPSELFDLNHHDRKWNSDWGNIAIHPRRFSFGTQHNKRCNPIRDNLDDAQRQGYSYNKVGE